MTKILYIPESFIQFKKATDPWEDTEIFEDSCFYFMPFEKDEDLINLILQLAYKYPENFHSPVSKEELEIIHD